MLVAHDVDPASRSVRSTGADYSDLLDLADEQFGLLVSLYAGFVSEACARDLRIGGTLLVSSSHGDAAMASIDPRYRLRGVVMSGSGDARVSERGLDEYLVAKSGAAVTKESLHASGRKVAYTKSAFAYLFECIA